MLPFHPTMFPHQATIWPLVEAEGPSGGTEETFPEAAGECLACRVRFANQREVMAALGESSLTPAQVAFPADPGVKLGDRIVAEGRHLRVLGPAQSRGGGGLFVVACQVVD